MMGKASAPQAPDPVQTANAQTASNRDTAITQAGLNAQNQITPYGNLTYSQIGTWADGTPRYQAEQTLNPQSQQLFNTGQQTQQNLATLAQEQSGRLSGLLNQNLNFNSLPQGGQWQNNDYSADRQRVEGALFDRLNPQIDRQRQMLETDLVNRGIRPGSSAYSQQINDFNQGLNDQRTSILLQGGNEQTRLQNMQLAGFNAQNTQRQNALQELLAQRQAPINEILALSGQSQLQQPNFVNTPVTGVAGTDIAGLTQQNYANQYQNYANQQNQSNQALGGLFSAGAALLPLLSDERLKEDMFLVAKHPVGVEIFDYKRKDTGKRERGVIAQHLEKVRPDLVDNSHPDGFKRVWYSRLNKEFPDAYVHP